VHPSANRLRLRSVTALLLTLLFAGVLATGVVLFIQPTGRWARWTDWQLLGLDKWQWQGMHLNLSAGFIVIALLHLAINWRAFLSHLRAKRAMARRLRWELPIAGGLAAVFMWAAYVQVTPFNWLPEWRSVWQQSWEASADRASEATNRVAGVDEETEEAEIPTPSAEPGPRRGGNGWRSGGRGGGRASNPPSSSSRP
jgi:hypothetical protein